MIVNPWRRIRELERDLFYAERGEKSWRDHALAAEQELLLIRRANSERTAKGNRTRKAKRDRDALRLELERKRGGEE